MAASELCFEAAVPFAIVVAAVVVVVVVAAAVVVAEGDLEGVVVRCRQIVGPVVAEEAGALEGAVEVEEVEVLA